MTSPNIEYIYIEKDGKGKPYTICDIVEFEGMRWIAKRKRSRPATATRYGVTLIPVEDKKWLEISDGELHTQQKITSALLKAKKKSLHEEIKDIEYIYTDRYGCRYTTCDIKGVRGKRCVVVGGGITDLHYLLGIKRFV